MFSKSIKSRVKRALEQRIKSAQEAHDAELEEVRARHEAEEAALLDKHVESILKNVTA